VPEFSHRRLQLVDKPDRTQTQILAGQSGVRLDDPDFFPLHVANHVFGGGSFSSRLMREIRVKRGWSYGAKSSFRHGTRPRSWNFYFFPASKDAPAALAEGLRMVEKLKAEGISQAEFRFARESLINGAGFSYNTPLKRVENTLTERTLGLPDGFVRGFAQRLREVELSQVNSALGRFLKPNALTITVLGTASELKEPLARAAGVPTAEVEVVPYTAD
jgi:zinc protease